MVTVEVAALPAKLRKLAEAALALGWASIYATQATVDDVTTLLVRFGHDDHRAYGVWTLGLTPKGKPSIKWRGGCSRHVPPGKFSTYDELVHYLGLA